MYYHIFDNIPSWEFLEEAMKFFQLEYMMAVCKHGSISKAADELLVSRPAVSRTVKDLEQEFGVELFRRTTSGVALTEAGLAFYDKCLKIEKLVGELKSEMETIKEYNAAEKEQWLNIGLSFTARCCIMPFLSDFSRRFPNVHLKMQDIEVSYLDQKEIDPELDLVISLSCEEPLEGTEHINVEESGFVFCCHKSHPLAGRESVSVMDIKDEPLINLSGLENRNNQTVRLYGKCGLKPNFVHETKQVSTVKQMIKGNLCSSVQPLQSMENDPEIATVTIDEAEKMYLRIMWSTDMRHRKAFYDFTDFAREYYGKK